MQPMCRLFVVLFLLIGAAECQKLVPLNSFKGRTVSLLNIPERCDIYVSATSDNDALLSEIALLSGPNMTSLLELKQNRAKEPFGYSLPFRVYKRTMVFNHLNDSQMHLLNGFLYTTTSQQTDDDSFRVVDVDWLKNVQFDKSQFEKQTLVVLNSDVTTTPVQTSVISAWNQSSEGSVLIYQGVPTSKIEKTDTQIFSNPVSTARGKRFFSTVEKFAMSLPAFYMKIRTPLSFSIRSDSFNLNMTRTYELSSTGFYMKKFEQPDEAITVVTMRHAPDFKEQFNKTVGANVIGTVKRGSSVSVSVKEDDLSADFKVTPNHKIRRFSTPNIGWNITFSSENAKDGQFFVQYFVIGYGYKQN